MMNLRLEAVEIVLLLLALGATGGLSAWLVARRAERAVGRTIAAASTMVSRGLGSEDSEHALGQITRDLAGFLRVDACVIALPTGDGRLAVGASYGYPDAGVRFIRETEGMCGRAYTTGEPVVAPDVRKDPHYLAQVPGMRSAVAIPLRHEGRVIGAFNLEASSRTFKQSDLATLVPLADQIAAIVENRRLRSESQNRAESEQRTRKELQAISSVVMAGVVAVNDLDAALDSMIAEISLQMGWDSMELLLFGDDDLLHTRSHYGYPDFATKVAFGPGEGIIGTVGATGRGRCVGDVTQDPDYLGILPDTRSEMCVPLVVGDRTVGALNAESRHADAFSDSEFRLLQTLADEMAVVIERARLAQLEHSALEQLRELDQLKDDFIATVSHELRTPLTSINGYARTLMSKDSSLDAAERRAFLEVIVRQCARLETMVESLLLVSRLEAGEVRFKPTYVLTREVVRDAAESADASNRVVCEVEDGRGVVTDLFRLHHILRNLIENGCKYSPQGARVLVRAADVDGGLRVDVLDQGPGIPEGMEEAIFERFRRLVDPGISGVPGTGLGLYISRRFAKDLGGNVVVSRSRDAAWPGACFTVTLQDLSPQAQSDASGPI